ncbi:MAG: hypothetical protein VX424_06235 [Actinomycetota bacterium]|nr:hypothetical protein [Actinomycetota bacterium]
MPEDLVVRAQQPGADAHAVLVGAGHPRLLYPVRQAREMLGGIGHSKTYELFKSGDLIKVNIGRRAFVTAESITAYVERLTKAATA